MQPSFLYHSVNCDFFLIKTGPERRELHVRLKKRKRRNAKNRENFLFVVYFQTTVASNHVR